MSNRVYDPHAYLLSLQLASTFKAIHDLGYRRDHYVKFKVLDTEQGVRISFDDYMDGKGKASVTVKVVTDNTVFNFIQHYRFGLLGELEIRYGDSTALNSLHDDLTNPNTANEHKTRLLIEFEYAISVYTEHVANLIEM